MRFRPRPRLKCLPCLASGYPSRTSVGWSGHWLAPPTLRKKGDDMQAILLAIAVWFGLELLLMAVLFALAAGEERQRARNARLARRLAHERGGERAAPAA